MFTVREIEELLGAKRFGGDPAAPVRSVTTDSRACRPGALFVALRGERQDGTAFAADASARQAAAVLLPRGAAPAGVQGRTAILEVDDPLAALGELAAAHRRQLRGRVVAITGSTGKTTTKELLHWLLSWSCEGQAAPASFNNHIGVPLTLLSGDPADDFLVTEVGTNAPGEIASLARLVQPDVAIVTCVGHSHLERLKTIDDVAIEKSQLLAHLRPRGIAILNAGDPRVTAMQTPPEVRRVRFALQDDAGHAPEAEVVGRVVASTIRGLEIEIHGVPGVERVQLPMLGRHNALNVLAAVAAARAVSPACLVPESWCSFRSPPMRMQIVERDDVVYLNDAYNANPQSMGAALATLAEIDAPGRIAVLGQMHELGARSEEYHREIGRVAAQLSLSALVVVGAGASGIALGAREAGLDPERVREANDIDGARDVLGQLVSGHRGQVVLLKGSRAAGLDRLLA